MTDSTAPVKAKKPKNAINAMIASSRTAKRKPIPFFNLPSGGTASLDAANNQVAVITKKIGRPTDYRPEMCAKVIEWGSQGHSREEICSDLGVYWTTMMNWAEANPAFLAALQEAKREEMLFFERLARNHNIETPGGNKLNTALWSRSIAARFPAKYRENAKLELTGKDGGPVQLDIVHDFSQGLLDELVGTRQVIEDIKSKP